MFLKTGELKKIMKSSLKKSGLVVGNINGHYLVYSDNWGMSIESIYASNKFKAAIMELIGDLPEPEECYRYEIGSDNEIVAQSEFGYPDPYERWKIAKDFAVIVPMFLHSWPHEYIVCQKRSTLEYITALRSLTTNVMSDNELDTMVEHRPERPSVLGSTLYWKNETTIYWVGTEYAGHKVEEALFPQLDGLDFFEDEWIKKNTEEPEEGPDNSEHLPY